MIDNYEQSLEKITEFMNSKIKERASLNRELTELRNIYVDLHKFFLKATAATLLEYIKEPGYKNLSRDRALAIRLGKKIEKQDSDWIKKHDKYVDVENSILIKKEAIEQIDKELEQASQEKITIGSLLKWKLTGEQFNQ